MEKLRQGYVELYSGSAPLSRIHAAAPNQREIAGAPSPQALQQPHVLHPCVIANRGFPHPAFSCKTHHLVACKFLVIGTAALLLLSSIMGCDPM